ncbi:hypothetical protein V6N11_070724 [Hibiscus sabdariffa]|uniref:NAC domain-containing protein n=1 Tax=Hibiscus sabdariffa TaxID=183260 RepID=A0ABR2QFW6_9ROSI
MAKPVLSKGEEIGLNKSLVYFRRKSPKGEKIDWLMHEYLLTKGPPPQRLSNQDMKLDDWVLCRVYTKKEKKLKHGTPIQYQELDTDVLDILIPQQQQLPPLQQHFSDVNQSRPLQQQQFSESEISPLE